MAALPDRPVADLIELRYLRAGDLDALLEDEIETWRTTFHWDFRPSAELVRRFLQMQSLNGVALLLHQEPIGYAYQICEERKGLIGDFYIRDRYKTQEHESLLLGALVESLVHSPGVRRIESQLMMLPCPTNRQLPFADCVRWYERFFMEIRQASVSQLSARTPAFKVRLQRWSDRMQEEAAHLIAASYRGHVDSEINDQYRSIPGARRFLTNIVKYPGCGMFCEPASFVAIDEGNGRLCGMCLASIVSPNNGHITQICVLPTAKGSRIGYELLRHSLLELANQGVKSTSLTVTAMNTQAVRLYESIGFVRQRVFPAVVWEDF